MEMNNATLAEWGKAPEPQPEGVKGYICIGMSSEILSPSVFTPLCNNECFESGHGYCLAKSTDGYCCSRNPGHEGPHVACGGCGGDHTLQIWAQEV